MTQIPYLSEDDIEFLKRLKEMYDNRELSRQTLRENQTTESAKNTYVAKVPANGIMGIVGDEPDSVRCELYKSVPISGIQTLVKLGRTERVYNFSAEEVPEGYTLVDRDSFGTWWAVVAGGGPEIIRFTIDSFENGVAIATPNASACGGELPSGISGTGTNAGKIELYDGLGCTLDDETEADLIGRTGYAIKMSISGTGTGTGSADTCRWEVLSLCCST